MKKKRYFGTDGIRAKVGKHPLVPEFALKLGWSAGNIFKKEGTNKILIGKDTRISGYVFESALEAGIASAGVDVVLLGPVPTPAVAYLTRAFHASAGIVVSASHNPFYYNGIKFFSATGEKLPDNIQSKIESLLEKEIQMVDSSRLGKVYRLDDAVGRYTEFCKSTFPRRYNLEEMKIVVDAANGATYSIAPQVFRELGAEVVEIASCPDGFNINKSCGSTHPNTIKKAVKEHQADVGIALDGDGDRILMVDDKGRTLDGDVILYLITRYYIDAGKFDGGVVGTVMTNMGIEKAYEELNIPFVKTKVGDKFINEKLKENGWMLGGEQSGHIVCRDHTTTGDGIVSSLQVLAFMKKTGKKLSELFDYVKPYPQILINVPVKNADGILSDNNIIKYIKRIESEMGENGRVLVRASGTEPVIRVLAESEKRARAKEIAESIVERIQSNL